MSCVGVVTSCSVGDCKTDTTGGGGEIEAEVEGNGSIVGASVSIGATLNVLGGVCFGVVIFALIGGNIVLVLGFRQPCVIPRQYY